MAMKQRNLCCSCKSKMHLQIKTKIEIYLFTTPRQKCLPGPYHHPLGRSFHELLNIKLLQMCICDEQRYNFNRIYIYISKCLDIRHRKT